MEELKELLRQREELNHRIQIVAHRLGVEVHDNGEVSFFADGYPNYPDLPESQESPIPGINTHMFLTTVRPPGWAAELDKGKESSWYKTFEANYHHSK